MFRGRNVLVHMYSLYMYVYVVFSAYTYKGLHCMSTSYISKSIPCMSASYKCNCVPCTSTLNISSVSFSIEARTPPVDETLPPPAPRVKSTLVDADDAEKKMDSGFSELSILDDVNVADQLVRSEPVRRLRMLCRLISNI